MTTTYQEPAYIAAAQAIYKAFQRKKGNIVSLLSDAMRVLRQMGPAGLDLWIKTDPNRQFIIQGLKNSHFSYNLRADDFNTAWSEVERLIKVLRYAKAYAKTQGE